MAGRPGGPRVRWWRRWRRRARRGGPGRREIWEYLREGVDVLGNTARGGCGRPRAAAWALSLLARQVGRGHRRGRGLPRRLAANAHEPRAGVDEGREPPRAGSEHVHPAEAWFAIVTTARDHCTSHNTEINTEHVAPLHSADGRPTRTPPLHRPRACVRESGGPERGVRVGLPVGGVQRCEVFHVDLDLLKVGCSTLISILALCCATCDGRTAGSMRPLQHGGNLPSLVIPAPLRERELPDASGGSGVRPCPLWRSGAGAAPFGGVRKIHARM